MTLPAFFDVNPSLICYEKHDDRNISMVLQAYISYFIVKSGGRPVVPVSRMSPTV